MIQDFRVAVRLLFKNPAFTLVAALSLALGIGANSAIFSLLDGLYLRPLAVPDSGRIMRVFFSSPEDSHGLMSYPEYRDLRAAVTGFDGLAACMGRGATYEQDGVRRMLLVNVVSPDFFQVLDVQPHQGRFFTPADEGTPLVVLGYEAWQRLFGGDPGIVGRAIRLTGASVTIAGVLPRQFRDIRVAGDRDIWAPPWTWGVMSGGGSSDFENRRFRVYSVLGRRKAGAGSGELNAQTEAWGRRLAQDHPETNKSLRAFAISDFEWRWSNSKESAVALLAIVFLVVLIAAVNVANLLLARLEARRREIAVRAALGASAWRLARQFLSESLVLGALGMIGGLVIAVWLIGAVPRLLVSVPGYRLFEEFQMDGRVFLGAAAVTALTAGLISLAPAFSAWRLRLMTVLRGGAGAGGRRRPLRIYLAAAQVALSLVLLTLASVLAASFANTRTQHLGFAQKNLLLAWVHGAERTYPAAAERIATLPGVRRVATATRAPLSISGGGMFVRMTIPGHPAFRGGERPAEIKFNNVDGAFFQVMGTRILRGRPFEERDRAGSPCVTIVNETLARRYWPEEDPLGKWIEVSGMASGKCQVTGIAEDTPINSIGEAREPYLYLPFWPAWEMTLLIETEGDPPALASAVRSALAGVDRRLEPMSLGTMQDLIRYSARYYQVRAELAAALAIVGLLLTAVGLHGIMAYGVTLRTREIGIRMALGARRGRVVDLVVRQALMLAAAGSLCGVPLALAAGYSMRSMLFGVPAWHPWSFVAALAVIFVTTGIASLIPARRAAGVDPASVLREE
jgi:predicted permease